MPHPGCPQIQDAEGPCIPEQHPNTVPCEEDNRSKTRRNRLSGDQAHSPGPSALSDQGQDLRHRDTCPVHLPTSPSFLWITPQLL